MKNILLIFFMFSCSLLQGQTELKMNILFWNVENLFDSKHDSLKNDIDFLPQSLKHWTFKKYRKKLQSIAKGIATAGEWLPPALVGLCEVENDSVIFDLTQRTNLNALGYKYIVTNSKDTRGIDVALLYQPEHFKLIYTQNISVGMLKKGNRPTRDILHATGLVISGDTLDLFIAHLPSRFGGQKASEPNRIQASSILKQHIDSILIIRKEPHIIIMGDFNDYPQNKSVKDVLKAQSPNTIIQKGQLYHLLARKRTKYNWGTYKYKNEWGILDHFIVSGSLLDSTKTCFTSEEKTKIVKSPFLLIKDLKYGGYKPFRTYNGMHYQGGYSDHLPIISTFTLKL